LQHLAERGEFAPPALRDLEEALESCQGMDSTLVFADLWDAEQLAGCLACRQNRLERLRRINLSGSAPPAIECPQCD
jgi:hypothetical protein